MKEKLVINWRRVYLENGLDIQVFDAIQSGKYDTLQFGHSKNDTEGATAHEQPTTA